MIEDKGVLCIKGYHDLGNLRKDALIKSGDYMINDKGVLCIKGYHDLGNLGGVAHKDALIESNDHMVNDKGERCIKGYQDLGNLRKDALIERQGHMANAKGKWVITGYSKLAKKGNTTKAAKHDAIALGEHHSRICISAICKRGASIYWEKGYPKIHHHYHDPEKSKLAGQKARREKGLLLHVCKKCHRTAKQCNGTSWLASACRSNNLKICQHLH